MYKKKLIYGIITARAGSKSIPNKNIKLLNGKPLIYYPIQTSLRSNLIDKTLISTDSRRIAKIAKKYKCEVPFLRPKKFAGDKSTDYDVFKHISTWLKTKNILPDYFVHFRPTLPIRNVKLIDKAIKKFVDSKNYDSLRSLSIAKETPFKMWFKFKKLIKPVVSLKKIKESHSVPRQILPVSYWQNGYVDIIKASTIIKEKSMVGKNVMPFLIKEDIADIDYIEEYKNLKKNFFKLKKMKKKKLRHPN